MKRAILALVLFSTLHASHTLSTGGCENVKCPPRNGPHVFHLPHPSDCNSYCECDWGEAVHMPCPAGLHFNARMQVCDWPAAANCDGNDSPLPRPTKPSTEIKTTKPPPSTQAPINNGCANVKCPPTNTFFAVHLPNPYDCGSFCKCDWGEGIFMLCPPGLHFNVILEVCDWPESANCDINPVTSLPSSTIQISTETTLNIDNSTTEFVSTTIVPNTTLNMDTSTTEFVSTTMVPNTTLNIETTTSEPSTTPDLSTTTDSNTTSNNDVSTTSFPTTIDNQTSTTEIPLASSTIDTNTTSEPTTTTNLPTSPDPANGCLSVECPAENDIYALHLPNPIDCSSFCQCNWGSAIYMPCPPGLHFNPQLQVCDWPQNANCNLSPPTPTNTPMTSPSPGTTNLVTETSPQTTTAEPVVTTPTNTPMTSQSPGTTNLVTETSPHTTTTEPVATTPKPDCSGVTCPTENGEFALHLPHPTNCASFCQCDWGNAVYKECPPGLHFNAQLQVCDWPQNVECNPGPPAETTGAAIQVTTLGSTTTRRTTTERPTEEPTTIERTTTSF